MCHWIFLWISLTSLVAAIPEEHQYCAVRYRRLCQGKGRHVACQFPDAGPGPSCERYTPIKFTEDLKHFVTHYLNRRRQRIAAGNERVRGGVHLPKPQVMMLVEWDRELSLLAQRLADQCHFVHDDCRATVRYPYAGQTVGEVRWRRSSESDELSAQRAIRRVLDAWWGERRRVQPKQLTTPFRLTAKGTVWGHFSQLAVWNLQAVGCGAVRHGAEHPRLLLVCDFSHTNMLGQKTLVPGALASCPIHTARRPRTSYPLLCAPVRRPLPAEQETELEDNYEDYETPEQDDLDLTTTEMSEVPSTTKRRKGITKMKTIPVTVVTEQVTRKVPNKMHRGPQSTPATIKESIIQKLDRELEQKMQNERQKQSSNQKMSNQNTDDNNLFEEIISSQHEQPDQAENHKMANNRDDNNQFDEPINSQMTDQPVNHKVAQNTDDNNQFDEPISSPVERQKPPAYKQAHKTFDNNQFEERINNQGNEWRARKKQKFVQWRQQEEAQEQENSEEVLPLTLTPTETTESYEARVAEIYRPGGAPMREAEKSRTVDDRERERQVYRPTIVIEDEEKNTDADDSNFRPRWRQTRIRPQRPGANALLSHPSTTHAGKNYKKEFMQASLSLDREDIDQLFRDTGFNVNWRKHTTAYPS